MQQLFNLETSISVLMRDIRSLQWWIPHTGWPPQREMLVVFGQIPLWGAHRNHPKGLTGRLMDSQYELKTHGATVGIFWSDTTVDLPREINSWCTSANIHWAGTGHPTRALHGMDLGRSICGLLLTESKRGLYHVRNTYMGCIHASYKKSFWCALMERS